MKATDNCLVTHFSLYSDKNGYDFDTHRDFNDESDGLYSAIDFKKILLKANINSQRINKGTRTVQTLPWIFKTKLFN